MALSQLFNGPNRAIRKLSLPDGLGNDFHRFLIGFRRFQGPLNSSWPLDPSGPPLESPWHETNKKLP